MSHIISLTDLVFDNTSKKYTLTFHKPINPRAFHFKQFVYQTSAAVHPDCVIFHSDLKNYQTGRNSVLGGNTNSHSTAICLLTELHTSGKYNLKAPVVVPVDSHHAFKTLSFWFTDAEGALLSAATSQQNQETSLAEQVEAFGSDLICFLDFAPGRTLSSTYQEASSAGDPVNYMYSRGQNSDLVYALQYGTHCQLANCGSTKGVTRVSSWQSFADSSPYQYGSDFMIEDTVTVCTLVNFPDTSYTELIDISVLRLFFMNGTLQQR